MTQQLFRNFVFALFATVAVFAQGPNSLVANVPFGFHVGNSMLPSGEYTVDTNVAPGLVRLRSADSKSAVMIFANNVQTNTAPSKGKLIFNKYGDEYFLSQIWKAGIETGCQLRKTKRELEVAAYRRRGIEPVLARK
jgi:hypothetical protein